MHFDAVLSLVGINSHVISLIGSLVFLEFCTINSLVDILDRFEARWSELINVVTGLNYLLSRSKGRCPNGVSYAPHGDKSHPSIDLWCDGPRMKTRFLEQDQSPIRTQEYLRAQHVHPGGINTLVSPCSCRPRICISCMSNHEM
jgi:hypothetical protein